MKYLWAFLTSIVWKDLFKPRYAIRFRVTTLPVPKGNNLDKLLFDPKPYAVCSEVPFKRPFSVGFNAFYGHLSGDGSYNVVAGHKWVLKRLYGIGSVLPHNFAKPTIVRLVKARLHLVVASSLEAAKALVVHEKINRSGDVTSLANIYKLYTTEEWKTFHHGPGLVKHLTSFEKFQNFMMRQPKDANIVVWVPGCIVSHDHPTKDPVLGISHYGVEMHPVGYSMISMADSVWSEHQKPWTGDPSENTNPHFFVMKHRTWKFGRDVYLPKLKEAQK